MVQCALNSGVPSGFGALRSGARVVLPFTCSGDRSIFQMAVRFRACIANARHLNSKLLLSPSRTGSRSIKSLLAQRLRSQSAPRPPHSPDRFAEHSFARSNIIESDAPPSRLFDISRHGIAARRSHPLTDRSTPRPLACIRRPRGSWTQGSVSSPVLCHPIDRKSAGRRSPSLPVDPMQQQPLGELSHVSTHDAPSRPPCFQWQWADDAFQRP